MLISPSFLAINLGYINKSSYYLVATLGGLGFGAFINELGKFITGDNDYFCQLTVALIYIIFVLLYQGIEAFVHKTKLTEPRQSRDKALRELLYAKLCLRMDLHTIFPTLSFFDLADLA